MQKKKKKDYTIDMCNGPILKKMLIFSIPLMCSSVMQLLFNAADVVVVGNFAGDNSLAAVGSNTALIGLLTNLFVGLSIGANVLAAKYYGAKDKKNLAEAVHTSILLSIISGIILTIIGVLGARRILIWMQTPDEVLDLAVTYLRICFLGMIPTMIYNFGSAILRSVGDTKRPLYFLLGSGIVNVIFNLFLVVELRMDVAGVAIATVISQCISALFIIRCLRHEEGGMHLEIHKLHLDKKAFAEIIKIGLPAGFQGVLFSLSNVIIQSSVNSFGATVMAGNSAAANVEQFVYFAMNAFYQSTISFSSQNYGAKNYHRIKKILLTGQLCVITVGVIFGNLVVLFGHQLLGLYTSSEEVIQAGMVRFGIVARTYALCGIMDVMVGALRGIGYSVMPMIVSLMGACVFRLVWISTIFRMDNFHSVQVVYDSYPISWIVTNIVHIICFIWAMKKITREHEEDISLAKAS
ncbi:MAG TPA: MATE family efflux transporter [Clostridium sp.]|nr:MATE family efflux transporter [Clostridium sp.]